MGAVSTTRGSKIVGVGAWTILISALLPWFTSGPMSQGVLAGRSWIALLARLAALLHVRPMSTGRVDVSFVRLGLAGVGLLTAVSVLIVRPAALGPSGGVVVCIVGSLLLGIGALVGLRRERDPSASHGDAPHHLSSIRSPSNEVAPPWWSTMPMAACALHPSLRPDRLLDACCERFPTSCCSLSACW